MKNLNNEKVKGILEQCTKDKILDSHLVQDKLTEYFQDKAVLGFDIYRYSKFPMVKQSLIPYVFNILYEGTIKNCLKQESFLFQNYNENEFLDYFIDSGDGGFQIFNNPLDAIIFAIYFQSNIQRYNSGFLTDFVELGNFIGEITIRYSLTYDNIYRLNKKFYGSAIINNSRIISIDKLNRFLIDENAFIWFRKKINGIESLIVFDESDFNNIDILDNYGFEGKVSYLFNQKDKSRFLNVDSLKIGEIQSKQDKISVYSIYLQTYMSSPGKRLEKIVVSIGNLNSSDIL
jgi:hypothetical protein